MNQCLLCAAKLQNFDHIPHQVRTGAKDSSEHGGLGLGLHKQQTFSTSGLRKGSSLMILQLCVLRESTLEVLL